MTLKWFGTLPGPHEGLENVVLVFGSHVNFTTRISYKYVGTTATTAESKKRKEFTTEGPSTGQSLAGGDFFFRTACTASYLYQPKFQKSGSGLRRSSSWRKFKDTVRDTVTGMVQKTVKSGSVGGSGDTANLMSSLDNEEVEDLEPPEVPPPPPPPGLTTS